MFERNGQLLLGRLSLGDTDAAAGLIHQSLAVWYDRNLNQPDRFGQAWEPFRVFPDIYQALDPNCGVSARDAVSGELLGVCFYHPRPSHIAVGIVATHPQAGGRGIARAMVQEVLSLADASQLPVRLVSSLMNLESFSLYTRLGFVPGTIFQDLWFPPGILPLLAPPPGTLRPAVAADVTAMAALEERLTGLQRKQDFHFFVQNDPAVWHTLVLIRLDGNLTGFLSSINDGTTVMIGPGCMEDDAGALALLTAQLHHRAPAAPVLLVPARATGLIASLYQAGARNLELHTAQVRGPSLEPQGIVIPTFLPESG